MIEIIVKIEDDVAKMQNGEKTMAAISMDVVDHDPNEMEQFLAMHIIGPVSEAMQSGTKDAQKTMSEFHEEPSIVIATAKK